jgi:hypothetical protein
MADESKSEAGEQGGARRREGASGTDITGGTDKTGRGGLADGNAPAKGDTGARETGDLTGATSTHAGAGGVMENSGGTGTAPTE